MKHLLFIIIISLSFSIDSHAQAWEPMDHGIRYVGTNFSGIHDIKIDPVSGEILICGQFYFDGHGNSHNGFSSWNRHEELWEPLSFPIESFGGTYTGGSHTIDFYGEKLFVTGYNPNFTPDESVFCSIENNTLNYINNGPHSTVLNSEIIDDKLCLVGTFTEVDGMRTHGIAIYDGEDWETVDIGYESSNVFLNDIVKWRGDYYVVGRDLHESPEFDYHGLARVKNGTLESVHEDFTGNFFSLDVYTLAVFQDKLFIGGKFYDEMGGFTGDFIQYFDGEEMHSVGGANAAIQDMLVYKGELYVAGGFTRIGEGAGYQSNEGGIESRGVAKWDGENWHSLNTLEMDGFVRVIQIHNDTLYIGGNWRAMGGDSTKASIARRKITPSPGLTTLESFNLYPNPATGELNFDFGHVIDEPASIHIYNQLGQSVKNFQINAWEQTFTLNTVELSTGIYHVRVRLGDAIETKKVVIE